MLTKTLHRYVEESTFKKSSFVKECSEHNASYQEDEEANIHERKHLLASQLLHIGFDKRGDKLVESTKGQRLKHWMHIHTWLTVFNSVIKEKSAFCYLTPERRKTRTDRIQKLIQTDTSGNKWHFLMVFLCSPFRVFSHIVLIKQTKLSPFKVDQQRRDSVLFAFTFSDNLKQDWVLTLQTTFYKSTLEHIIITLLFSPDTPFLSLNAS